MKIIFQAMIKAIKRDPSYLVLAVLTGLILIILMSKHDWSSKPTLREGELPDFSQFLDVQKKKQAFFDFLRPIIQKQNQKLKYKSVLVNKLLADFESDPYHTGLVSRKLSRLFAEFRLDDESLSGLSTRNRIEELKKRVLPIPASLVLAQAANESGWGTSRFARQANNLFGEWCFTEGCGIVPNKRDDSQKHEVRKFSSVEASVVSYMNNLNSHPAYQELRDIRWILFNQKRPVTGQKLAVGLLHYSERGEAYVNEISALIRHNHLE